MRRAKVVVAGLIVSLAILPLFQNCGETSKLEFAQALTNHLMLQNESLKTFNGKCVQCHNPQNAQGAVYDISDIDYLLYSRLVIAGEPDISLLLDQIKTGDCPKEGNILSPNEVDTIKRWVVSLGKVDYMVGSVSGIAPPEPKFSALNAQIFGPRCSNCHASRVPRLSTYDDIRAVALTQRQKSDGTSDSLLYLMITVGNANGRIMPNGGPYLSGEEKQAIRTWINNGALND